MQQSSAPIPFVSGDDLVEPFRVVDSTGQVVDLTGANVQASVLYSGKILDLEVGTGIQLVNLLPSNTDPHGFFYLTRGQTTLLAQAMRIAVRIVVTSAAGLRTSTYLVFLERIA